MRVVVAGGTGFLGRALTSTLLQGHQVVLLTRSGRAAHVPAVAWAPDGTVGAWAEAIDGADVVVNLAGESIGAGRWTDARRRAIRDSRILATRSLVEACRQAKRPPSVFVSGSAQGYYGDRGDEVLTEASAPGRDFLAGVCVEWEAEAREASALARLVLLRTALVLDRDEGALPRMVQPFKLLAGGPLGGGRQFVSWIHHEDWVGIVARAIADERFAGPINVGSPNPVRNAEFAKAIGKAVGRPSWISSPAPALRAVLGEMADALLLSSQRMAPARALDLGYEFRHPNHGEALAAILR